MPVPIALIRSHLNLDHNHDDELLTHYAAAAEAWVAAYIGSPFTADDPRLVQAVLLMTAFSYQQREAATFSTVFSVPYGVADMLSGLKTRITGHQPEPEVTA